MAKRKSKPENVARLPAYAAVIKVFGGRRKIADSFLLHLYQLGFSIGPNLYTPKRRPDGDAAA